MLHDSADDQNFENSLEKEVERLARLPILDYEQCRKEVADRFDVRASVLDSEVANARRDDDGNTERQGQPLGLDDPEPWPDPVDGDALLDEIVMRVRRYLVLTRYGHSRLSRPWPWPVSEISPRPSQTVQFLYPCGAPCLKKLLNPSEATALTTSAS